MSGKSTYSDQVAEAILSRLAAGEPLSRICLDAGMPNVATVYRWIEANASFRDKYTHAREDQADTLADDIVRIADEPPPPDAETGKIDAAWVAWQRNRVEARKWTASKLKPKKYGDKVQLGGDADNPLVVVGRIERVIVDKVGDGD